MSFHKTKLGEGKISGYIPIFLALLSFFAVLCFKFPELLTTPELRNVYTAESMKNLLVGVLIASLFFAVLSFLLSQTKGKALIGILICAITVFMGGFTVEGRAVDRVTFHLGLDWVILDLLLMAVIFIPIESVWPKNKGQPRFHDEWRTDLVYFIIGHLFIQIFGVFTQKPASLFFSHIGFSSLQAWVSDLPFIAGLFLALFVTDFFQYWVHRVFHTFRVACISWISSSRVP